MPDQLIVNENIPIAINNLIDQASDYVLLVSPYIRIWGHLRNHLERCHAKTRIAIVRDENIKEKAETLCELNSLGITVKALINLHAKIYLSEKACIISSMNLYDFSAANSEEIAVLITDKDSLSEIRQYVKDNLSSRAREIKSQKLHAERATSSGYKSKPQTNKHKSEGQCIRCGKSIGLDPARPYCRVCYEAWALYENPEYREKF